MRLRQRLRRTFRSGGERWRNFFGRRTNEEEVGLPFSAQEYPAAERQYLHLRNAAGGDGSGGGIGSAGSGGRRFTDRRRRPASGGRRWGQEAWKWPRWVAQSLTALVAFILIFGYAHSRLPGSASLQDLIVRTVTADYDFHGLLAKVPSLDKVKSVFGSGVLTRLWWRGDEGEGPPGGGTGQVAGDPLSLKMVAPVPGAVSSGFGWRVNPVTNKEEFHPGLDLKGNSGELILSPAAGKVLRVGNDPTGYGKWLEIDHGSGVSTIFGHTSEILVKEKDTVKQGQVIAKVGQSGLAVGPHLHFEVRRNGEAIDPSPVLGLAKAN